MDSSQALIYLAGCAVNGVVPDKSRIDDADMAGLHAEAERHMLAAIVGYALETAGINHGLFTQSRAKALRKMVILESDCREISACLESSGIWHMPLKGSVMKDYYPAFGVREMSDVDILFDDSRADDVKKIMTGLGFQVKDFCNHNHDTYTHEPVSNIEMHRSLVEPVVKLSLGEYFYDVKERLIPNDGTNYTYHFSTEDFYLYMTAHAYRHYSEGGTGLRAVLDEYVYVKKFSGSLDWEYISREARKMDMAEFEHDLRELAVSLFGGGEISEAGRKMLEYIVKSGAYGLIDTEAENVLMKVYGGSRLRYILAKIFPPFRLLKYRNPYIYKHKYLYPLFVLRRLFKAATSSRKYAVIMLREILRGNR